MMANTKKTAAGTTRGATAVRPPQKTPLGWIVPVVILLLALIVAGVALLLLNANDNNDDPGVDVQDDQEGSQPLAPAISTLPRV